MRLLRGEPAVEPDVCVRAGRGGLGRVEKQTAYLTALRTTGVSATAAKIAGICSRATLARWRSDPAFRQREAGAWEDARDLLRALIHVRAFQSDAVLLLLVRALLPECRPVRQEHAGADALPAAFTFTIGALDREATRAQETA